MQKKAAKAVREMIAGQIQEDLKTKELKPLKLEDLAKSLDVEIE